MQAWRALIMRAPEYGWWKKEIMDYFGEVPHYYPGI
jgi:hypothetical protein